MPTRPAINIPSNFDENTLHPALQASRDQQQDANTQPFPPGGLHCGLCGRLPGTQARAQATVLSWLLWPTATSSLWRICTLWISWLNYAKHVHGYGQMEMETGIDYILDTRALNLHHLLDIFWYGALNWPLLLEMEFF